MGSDSENVGLSELLERFRVEGEEGKPLWERTIGKGRKTKTKGRETKTRGKKKDKEGGKKDKERGKKRKIQKSGKVKKGRSEKKTEKKKSTVRECGRAKKRDSVNPDPCLTGGVSLGGDGFGFAYSGFSPIQYEKEKWSPANVIAGNVQRAVINQSLFDGFFFSITWESD